ncbi:MAG: arginine--tRNA ligase, partial [Microcystaceae cyanobacterium]
MASLLEQLNTLFTTAIASVVGENVTIPTPVIVPASNPKFGDFQCNGALPLAKILGEKPRAI